MSSVKQHENLWVAVKAVIVAVICLLYSVYSNGITSDIFSVPLNYINSSDAYNWYLAEKNLLETGTVLSNPRLGAPFVSELYDFPVFMTFNFDLLVLRVVLLFFPDVFISLNLYYVILPAFTGLTAFFALRSLDTPDWLNMGGAVAYAFLPFYYMRGLEHFALTAYQFVPLAFLFCIWGWQGKVFTDFTKRGFAGNYRNWLALIICALIANNGNGYWQAFSCFFLLITGLLALYDTKGWKTALSCFIPLVLIAGLFAAALYPSFQYQMAHGRNLEAGRRGATEADEFGLKMSQMLLPYEIPGNTGIEVKFKRYLKAAPLTNENRSAYLGVIGTAGFLLLLLRLLRKGKGLEPSDPGSLPDLFARLNICALLLATVGGAATVFSVFIGPGIMLRSYNRISVYIAFLAVATVCLYAGKLLERTEGRKAFLCRIGMCIALLLHFVCLYSWFHIRPDYEMLHKKYQSDKQFVTAVEAALPEAAIVYQLPYHKFPEGWFVNKMPDYQLLTGFFHSQKLKWSYGAIRGRAGDTWHTRVSALPLAQRMKALSFAGFQGVCIDRRAYTKDELKKLEKELTILLKTKPLESQDKKLAFFAMEDFNKKILAKYSEQEKEKIRNRLLHPVRVTSRTGIYRIETKAGESRQWLDRTARMEFVNEAGPYKQKVRLRIAANVAVPADLEIMVNQRKYTYRLDSRETTIRVPIQIRQGKNVIGLRLDSSKAPGVKEGQYRCLQLVNCSMNDFLPKLL